MATNPPKTPPGADPAQQEKDDAAATERVWETPLDVGEEIDFDPAVHKPTLTPEEIEKALKEVKPK